MKQCGLCIAGCLPFPSVWLEPRLGKVTSEMPGKSHALPPALGGHGGNGSLVSLPEAGRGGRSARRTGGHHHALNPERKLLGEQRMSRISRVGRVRSGLGENKAQGSPALLPLPPSFLLARDGDRWLPGEGSCQGRSWPVAAHVAFREAGRLCVPQFPSAEMCCVQQDGAQVLACQWWPWRARLLCAGACCALGLLRRCWPGGWHPSGKEGAPIPCESLVPPVPEQSGVPHADACHAPTTALRSWASILHLWCLQSLLESSGLLPACCGQGVVAPGEDLVSGEDWERGSPREQLPCPQTVTQPVLPPMLSSGLGVFFSLSCS